MTDDIDSMNDSRLSWSVMRAFIVRSVIVVLCLVGSQRPAMADTTFYCEMKGKWIEAKEDWWFSATYTSKVGDADTFTGNFINAKAGARATITGSASRGTWNIKFTYIDQGHPGWVRELVGQGGKNAKHQIGIKGTFTLKKSEASSGQGTFTLIGQCKPK